MFMNPDKPYKKLLKSSAAPSEGKTTVACTLRSRSLRVSNAWCIVDQ